MVRKAIAHSRALHKLLHPKQERAQSTPEARLKSQPGFHQPAHHLLPGIYPGAIALLQDQESSPDVMRILHDMNAARQVESVALMVACNAITIAPVAALLKATAPVQRAHVLQPRLSSKIAPTAQLGKLKKGMDQVVTTCKQPENPHGLDQLNLVVAKGYLTTLLANAAGKNNIERKELASKTVTRQFVRPMPAVAIFKSLVVRAMSLPDRIFR